MSRMNILSMYPIDTGDIEIITTVETALITVSPEEGKTVLVPVRDGIIKCSEGVANILLGEIGPPEYRRSVIDAGEGVTLGTGTASEKPQEALTKEKPTLPPPDEKTFPATGKYEAIHDVGWQFLLVDPAGNIAEKKLKKVDALAKAEELNKAVSQNEEPELSGDALTAETYATIETAEALTEALKGVTSGDILMDLLETETQAETPREDFVAALNARVDELKK